MKILKLDNADFKLHKESVKVDYSDKFSEPINLYKYYSLSKYSIQGLNNGSIYFSHPNLLNDPLDGNLILWDMHDFIEEYKKETGRTESNQFLATYFIRKLSKDFLKYKGVFSLSSIYSNELLWVHYASETGYCLELNVKELKESLENKHNVLLFPISYGVLKQINVNEYIEKTRVSKNKTTDSNIINANLPLFYTLAQKDKFWEYEKEWRFVLTDEKFNSVSFPTEILSDAQKNDENTKMASGCVKIEKKVIEKILLAPLFFNNNRFNSEEYIDKNILLYKAKNNENGQEIISFFEVLFQNYNDRIFQVDKIIVDGIVRREIEYKISIIDVVGNFIKIRREKNSK